jgi:hypothetical protein
VRYQFGGGLDEWAYITDGDPPIVQAGVSLTVTFWSAFTDGFQYVDLATAADGSGPISSVITANGSGGEQPGAIPFFYGPDGITEMWAGVADFPRARIVSKEAMALASRLGHTFVFSAAGELATNTGAHRIYNDTGVPLTIRAVRASVGTAPTGAAVVVDAHKNGVTIFTTQANRPSIAAAGFTAKVTNQDVTAFADGEYLTVDVDQVGSTVAGADLTVQILCF